MSDGMVTINIMKQIGTIEDTSSLGQIMRCASRQIEKISTDGIGWFVGQKVKLATRFSGRKLYGVEGEIVKVNVKKLKVDFGDGKIYNCPKMMMIAV